MILKLIFTSILLAVLSGCVTPTQSSAGGVTTIYLVRHAEKVKDDSGDPALTKIGKQRARKWADILSKEKITAVYSTDTIRTRDTAKPIALVHGLQVQLYSAREVNHQEFLAQNRGKSVAVVGHSNTVPGFANGLTQQNIYSDLDESQYSNLFIVNEINGVTTSKVLQVHLDNITKEATMPAHEKINYLEYPAKDIVATKAFFIQAFGWEFVDYGPEYASFSNQGTDGGFYQADLVSDSGKGAALTVFYSAQLEKTLENVTEAGGSIIKPIFSFPGGRRFHFTEPSGNEFAVWGE